MAGTTDLDWVARGDDLPEPPENGTFTRTQEERRLAAREARRGRLAARNLGFTARHPAWPITALLVGYPIWWGLGLADFVWILLIPPMVLQMISWHLSAAGGCGCRQDSASGCSS